MSSNPTSNGAHVGVGVGSVPAKTPLLMQREAASVKVVIFQLVRVNVGFISFSISSIGSISEMGWEERENSL
jgi:hypothetical protein